jgi:hypothetical protein
MYQAGIVGCRREGTLCEIVCGGLRSQVAGLAQIFESQPTAP